MSASLQGLDMNLVVALSSLLQHRNVTRAAHVVGLGQSSMSHALARLRDHFGDRLLVPVGRAMVLTDRARALEEPVARAMRELARVFLEPATFEPATSRRVFRIAAPDNVELYLLPTLIAALARDAPHVALRVVPVPDDWQRQLLHGELDLKLGRVAPLPALPPGLRSAELFREAFVCVVRAQHQLAGRRVRLAQFAELRHVVVKPSASDLPGTHLDALLAQHGLQRRVVLHVPHFVLAPFLVEASDLVLTAAQRLIAPFERLLGLRRLVVPLELPRYALAQVWPRHAHDDPASAWLRAQITAAAATPLVTRRPGRTTRTTRTTGTTRAGAPP